MKKIVDLRGHRRYAHPSIVANSSKLVEVLAAALICE
jgi:hypothetical protein